MHNNTKKSTSHFFTNIGPQSLFLFEKKLVKIICIFHDLQKAQKVSSKGTNYYLTILHTNLYYAKEIMVFIHQRFLQSV